MSGKRSIADTRTVTLIGILAAFSAVLYALPGIPVIPPIYKLDFSCVPALMGAFATGPVGGILIALIKDLTGLMHSSSMGVGEIADFIVSAAFVASASLIYKRGRDLKSAIVGMICGTLAMAAAGAAGNYFVLIPFYSSAFGMPVDSIVEMIGNVIPAVDNLWKLILFAVVPFNVLKGAVVSVISELLFVSLKPVLDGKRR